MKLVGIVVLAPPPRDPIRSKRHNGQRLRALHTYSATMSPPPRSSKAWWWGRWDQQHDGVVLMVGSICGQGFACVCEVEEERLRKLVKLEQNEATRGNRWRLAVDQKSALVAALGLLFKSARSDFWKPNVEYTLPDRCRISIKDR
jgi:hypothetical protein